MKCICIWIFPVCYSTRAHTMHTIKYAHICPRCPDSINHGIATGMDGWVGTGVLVLVVGGWLDWFVQNTNNNKNTPATWTMCVSSHRIASHRFQSIDTDAHTR